MSLLGTGIYLPAYWHYSAAIYSCTSRGHRYPGTWVPLKVPSIWYSHRIGAAASWLRARATA
eukprot:SAG31_NODE_29730_length_390_cov_2.237113_1_plen_61_part_10